jgi:hypothetical protein
MRLLQKWLITIVDEYQERKQEEAEVGLQIIQKRRSLQEIKKKIILIAM